MTAIRNTYVDGISSPHLTALRRHKRLPRCILTPNVCVSRFLRRRYSFNAEHVDARRSRRIIRVGDTHRYNGTGVNRARFYSPRWLAS